MHSSGDRLKTLLVATDFSRGSENALERAIRLPLGTGARIHLLHVLPKNLPRKYRAELEQAAGLRLGQMAAAAGKTAQEAGSPRLKIAPKVARGETFWEIVRQARLASADLVVLGRHGRRGLRRLLIGSTAIRVIRKGDLPVLVVHQKPGGPYRRPLVAVGLEDATRAVLESALKVIDPAIKIPVVHSYWPPFEAEVLAQLSSDELAEYFRRLQKMAESGLKQILASLPAQPGRWQPVVRRGDPRSVVLAEVSRRKADLLAVGTHARSGLAHVLLGSVAEWLIQNVQCDVLVARPAHISFHLP